ncbi:MAG TPA: LuxR C-terminal-related transcriptional regulator [Candidatus Baltobacteraceae bacterium]|jgi:DNA-binding CsgD family transcriptional regulator
MFAQIGSDSLFTRQENPGTLIVLDEQYRVVGSVGEKRIDGRRLDTVLGRTIRKLTADWTDNPDTQREQTVFLSAIELARIFPLRGPHGYQIAVYVEPYRRRATPLERADTLGLLPSEYECVRLLAGGQSIAEIAATLTVPVTTIKGTVNRLQRRLKVKSEVELVATLTGHRRPAAPLADP